MDGKSLFGNITDLKENLYRYIETRFSYYKLVLFEKSARVLTSVFSTWVVSLVVFMAVMFISLAGAIYLGRLLESYELGLLIVGGFYLLLGLILYVFRVRIFSPGIIKGLARSFYDDEEDDLK
jgi:hypothetical protein